MQKAFFILFLLLLSNSVSAEEAYRNFEYKFEVEPVVGGVFCDNAVSVPNHGISIVFSPVGCDRDSVEKISISAEYNVLGDDHVNEFANRSCGKGNVKKSDKNIAGNATVFCRIKINNKQFLMYFFQRKIGNENLNWINYVISCELISKERDCGNLLSVINSIKFIE